MNSALWQLFYKTLETIAEIRTTAKANVFVCTIAGKCCVSVCIAAVANTVIIIDPTKVVRVALENAVSVVSVWL